MNSAMAQAANWFERLQNEDMSPEEVARWQDWMSTNPAHREAFERYEDLWKKLDGIPVPRLPTRAEMAERRPAQALRAALALAASLAMVSLFVWALRSRSTQAPLMRAFETAPAEHQETRLPDGSRLSLGAKSLVVVHFAREERAIALERGEAYFDVARDQSRPFVVRAGDASVTALGTAFDVRKSEARVVVSVSDGTVKVGDSRTGHEWRLKAGEQVALEPSRTAKIQPVDAGVATAWRDGRLQYRGEPLRYVLADVSRYSKEAITLETPQAGDLLVTGTVFESDVDAWLESLEAILPVSVERRGDGRVVRMRER